eukprot:6764515-Pyramimonas_sp.AAC.1
MIAALRLDETGKSKPPRGPPGGPGGDGDPDGPFRANRVNANRRSFANDKELNLLDIPSVQTLREWRQH